MPTERAIEKALGRLATNALVTWWILDSGRILLGLDCVRAYLPADPTDEKAYAIALRKYLEDATERVESRQYRIILEVVLGLGDDRWKAKEWRKRKAKVRREEAGRRFRGSDGIVRPETIRQHHEPRAIQALAAIMWSDERDARGEPPDDGVAGEDFADASV